MNDVERRRLARFIGLQVAHQVPSEAEAARRLDLQQRFLNLVFAEVDLTLAGDSAYVFGGKGLGDGDEADGGRIPTGPAGSIRKPIADAGQPCPKRGGIDGQAEL